MTISKADRLAKIHDRARKEFDRVQAAVRDERMQCLQDRRFYSIAGAQWEGPLGDQFDNKPRLEFNLVHMAIIRVVNEYRNNRITVDFTPKDGTSDADMADTCDGLYRSDERDSGAQEAYDNAFEEAVGGGMGAWRLRADYEDDEDDDNDQQRIRIEPIFDADSCVFFDLDAKRQDKADAKRCWVLTSMTFETFEDQFGHSPSTWPKAIRQTQFDWIGGNVVYVAEYYEIEESTELVHFYRGLVEGAPDMRVPDQQLQDDPQMEAELKAKGFREVRQKKLKRKKVHKYLMSGIGIEEDCGYIPGRCIPIVPVYGKRWYVDNTERCMGHVRLAKDAQRLQNSLLSWLTEMASKFDIEKPILTPEQVLGHATMWAEDNVKRYPYLLVNALKDADGNTLTTQPIGYTKAPNVPPAMAALVQIAGQALQDLLGNQEAGEQIQPNLSGKAVELIQTRLDMQVFIYLSNFSKGMQRSGEIWLSMMRDIVVEESRQMKTLSSDGEPDTVTLNHPVVDPETSEVTMENDISKATFDTWVDVGPSSTSKRAATVRALTGMAQINQDPDTAQVLTAAAIMNLDGEGLGDIQDFFRKKLVRMGVIKPTEEEKAQLAQEAQAQQPDAQSQYLLASAEQATANAARARAQVVETLADAELKHVQAQAAAVGAAADHQDMQIAGLEALQRALAPAGRPGLQ